MTQIQQHPKAGKTRAGDQADSQGKFFYLDPIQIAANYTTNRRGETEEQIRLDPETELLKDSICKHGVRNPLRGYWDKENLCPDGRFTFCLTSGFRRWTAYKMAIEMGCELPLLKGRDKFLIPVLPDHKATEEDLIVFQILDNQHKEWSPVALADCYLDLKNNYGKNSGQIADLFGTTPSAIQYYLIPAAISQVFDQVRNSNWSMSVANTTAKIIQKLKLDPEATVQKILNEISGKITAEKVKQLLNPTTPKPGTPTPSPNPPAPNPPTPSGDGPRVDPFQRDPDPHNPAPKLPDPKEINAYNPNEVLEFVLEELNGDKEMEKTILPATIEALMDCFRRKCTYEEITAKLRQIVWANNDKK